MHGVLCTVHSAGVWSTVTVCNAPCMAYIYYALWTMHIAQCITYSAWCIKQNAQCVVNSTLCTAPVHSTLHYTLRIVHSVLCTCTVQCARRPIRNVLCTLRTVFLYRCQYSCFQYAECVFISCSLATPYYISTSALPLLRQPPLCRPMVRYTRVCIT